MPTQVKVVTQNEQVALTQVNSTVKVVESLPGSQGIPGPTGATGATGPTGPTGVVAATAPVTYDSTSKTVALTTNTANGVPTLDSNGQIQTTQLPAIAVTNTSVVASEAAMLALSAEVGDVAVRTDLNKSFILAATPATTLANWQELLTPPDTVTSVAGKTGNVTLVNTDISGLGTASTRDIAASGNAASGEVVQGSDTRLTDARSPKLAYITISAVDENDFYIIPSTTGSVVVKNTVTTPSGEVNVRLPDDAPVGSVIKFVNESNCILNIYEYTVLASSFSPESNNASFVKTASNGWINDTTNKFSDLATISSSSNPILYFRNPLYEAYGQVEFDSNTSEFVFVSDSGTVTAGEFNAPVLSSSKFNSNEFYSQFNGGVHYPVVEISGSGITLNAHYTVVCSGTNSVYLPSSFTYVGRIYNIKQTSGGGSITTIIPAAGQSIDGLSQYQLTSRYQSVTLQATPSSGWVIL